MGVFSLRYTATSTSRGFTIWLRRLWKGVGLVVFMTMMIEVAGKLEGRRCRSSLTESGLTLVEQLHQTPCRQCLPPPGESNNDQNKSDAVMEGGEGESVSGKHNQINNSSASQLGKLCNVSDSSSKNNQCSSNSKKVPEKPHFHVVVLLMGMARMEKALVLTAELIDRDNFVTVVTTQQMSITNHLHDILRQHIPCDKNVMDFLNVEAFNMNDEAWPCQPQPTPSLHSTFNTDNVAHNSFYHTGKSDYSGRRGKKGTNNPFDSSMPLHCNAHHASGLVPKLLRIVTRMNRRTDVIVADSTLLAGLLVAEASKLPCLAIVPDDLSPSNPSSTLKWTHPHIYRQLQEKSNLADTTNFAVVLRQKLELWWTEWQDQLGMTAAFMAYNNVRRKLHLPPRYQILDFWKTTVLWTSLTRHLPDPPTGDPRAMNDTTENDATLVDLSAYLYSKTGIGIGTSASKGNSVPLLSLPEASVPPCQPCEVNENLENEQTLEMTQHLDDGICPATPDQLLQPEPIQILVPYYNYAKTLSDRQRFRKLMRALVLLRDSLLAWPKCTYEITARLKAERRFPSDCWISDAEYLDFEVIRLGNSYEAFVPSIVNQDLSPFLDAVANHKSIVAIILPDCKSSASSQWMMDLGLPSVCLPDNNNWNVRTIAVRIGRLLRKIARSRMTGEDVSAISVQIGGDSSERNMELRLQNGHTKYGTTIGNIANVIEVMATAKRDSRGNWITGDDMSWDVWLRLGLVRRSRSFGNNEDSLQPGWFKGTLVLLSWAILVAAGLYLFAKDSSDWFLAGYNHAMGISRRRRNNSQQDRGSSILQQTETEKSSTTDASFLTYFYWPTFIHMRTDSISDVWSVVVEEFMERVPDLDRLYDMWKDWAAEESEHMNLLFYGWFDQPEDAAPSASPTASTTKQRQQHPVDQNHYHSTTNNHHNNHAPPQQQTRKRRTKNKKH